MKKVLVIAPAVYNGAELFQLLKVLRRYEVPFDVMSTREEIVSERSPIHEGSVRIKTGCISSLKDISEYQALFCVSGDVARLRSMEKDFHIQTIIQTAFESGLTMCAVCISVRMLCSILKDRKATCYESITQRNYLEDICGGKYVPISVCVDGNIITGENSLSTQQWAEISVKHILNINAETPFKEVVGNITIGKRRSRKELNIHIKNRDLTK